MYGDFLRGLCYNIKAAFFVVCSVLYSYFCFGGLFVELKVNCGIWGTMFGVPHIVADNFLKLATGDQLKVLIYCLRCSGKSCSTEEISRNTGVSVNDVADSIMFWQQANVLTTNDSVPDSTVHQTIFNAADQTQNCESNNESLLYVSVRNRLFSLRKFLKFLIVQRIFPSFSKLLNLLSELSDIQCRILLSGFMSILV